MTRQPELVPLVHRLLGRVDQYTGRQVDILNHLRRNLSTCLPIYLFTYHFAFQR